MHTLAIWIGGIVLGVAFSILLWTTPRSIGALTLLVALFVNHGQIAKTLFTTDGTKMIALYWLIALLALSARFDYITLKERDSRWWRWKQGL